MLSQCGAAHEQTILPQRDTSEHHTGAWPSGGNRVSIAAFVPASSMATSTVVTDRDKHRVGAASDDQACAPLRRAVALWCSKRGVHGTAHRGVERRHAMGCNPIHRALTPIQSDYLTVDT
jgi:hypothetical protein